MAGYPRQRTVESMVRAAIKGGVKIARIECSENGVVIVPKDESAESANPSADDILRQWQQRHAKTRLLFPEQIQSGTHRV